MIRLCLTHFFDFYCIVVLSGFEEFFPELDHGESVEVAVFEEGLSGDFSLVGRHMNDLWEYGHGVATVMHWSL